MWCYVPVGDCKDPADPIDGTAQCDSVDHVHKRCTVKCHGHKTFLRPVPKFYSCGPMGLWNTNSPMNKFKFPPCGGTSTARELLAASFNMVMQCVWGTYRIARGHWYTIGPVML